MQHYGNFTGKSILWGIDSTNVVAFMEKGSAKPTIQKIVFDIVKLLHEENNTIKVFHLFREDPRIQLVDGLSKARDTDNWSIDFDNFHALHLQFRFSVDLFADKFNTRLTRFVCPYYCAEAIAMDAFTVPWTNMVWICSPYLCSIGSIIEFVPQTRKESLSFPCGRHHLFIAYFLGQTARQNPLSQSLNIFVLISHKMKMQLPPPFLEKSSLIL